MAALRREWPGTDYIGGSVGHTAGLGGCGKSVPTRIGTTETLQPVASRYTDWAIPAHMKCKALKCKKMQNSVVTSPSSSSSSSATMAFRLMFGPWLPPAFFLAAAYLVRSFPCLGPNHSLSTCWFRSQYFCLCNSGNAEKECTNI